jgi:hypothetical protein
MDPKCFAESHGSQLKKFVIMNRSPPVVTRLWQLIYMFAYLCLTASISFSKDPLNTVILIKEWSRLVGLWLLGRVPGGYTRDAR